MSINFSALNSLLSQYGISSSGNIQSTLTELKKAMQADGENTSVIDSFAGLISQKEALQNSELTDNSNNEQPSEKPQGGEPPWASLMQQLGLSMQGSPEADFAAISAKLSELSASATTPEQAANIASLESQFQQYQSMAPQGSMGENSSNMSSSMMQRIAQNNRQNQNQKSIRLPWNSLLDAVGIEPQGSPNADFTAISAKLQEMKSNGAQQSTIDALETKLTMYKSQSQIMTVRN